MKINMLSFLPVVNFSALHSLCKEWSSGQSSVCWVSVQLENVTRIAKFVPRCSRFFIWSSRWREVVPKSYQWWNRELTLKCKFKCLLNPWITHWALALVKGIREPHEVKKKSFDLGGNRTHDLRIRSTVTLPTELRGRTEKVRDDYGDEKMISLPRVVPWFPLLGLTPSGLFMGLIST